MRTVLLLTVALLPACASDSAYERGTTVRPPPTRPAFRPSEDAPHTTGQPGHERGRSVPRSTDRRVLPPESTPGIWASDGDARRAMELRICRPVPGRVPDGASRQMWHLCWSDVVELLRAEDAVFNLSEAEMECLRHLLLSDCAGWLMGRAKNAANGGGTEADREVMERYFPGALPDENAWDEAMNTATARRRARRCEDVNAYTERVRNLRYGLQIRGRDEKEWRDGVP